jgi:hypothetical protein
MSAFIETISTGQTEQITDLHVVGLMMLLGLAVTLISLGFGAGVVQGLTS